MPAIRKNFTYIFMCLDAIICVKSAKVTTTTTLEPFYEDYRPNKFFCPPPGPKWIDISRRCDGKEDCQARCSNIMEKRYCKKDLSIDEIDCQLYFTTTTRKPIRKCAETCPHGWTQVVKKCYLFTKKSGRRRMEDNYSFCKYTKNFPF